MNSETKICQNCKKDFTIEPEDFKFYEKIKVPAPTWCSKCRIERRMSFVNIWDLCWRNCDKCGKKTMSTYLPEQKILVYCQSCWWSDSWDGTEYGVDYDPSRPFLEQVYELMNKTPCFIRESDYLSIKNSEYSNGIGWSKDCYLVFFADFCENVYYSSILNGLKYSADCLRVQSSELCYESIGINRSYNTFFSEECDDCMNVWFSRNCYNCTNCIGCVNLRGAAHCIFNVKYSKEEYETKVKELGLDSWINLQKLEKEAHKFWLTKPKREYNGNSLNKNVTGECVFNSKNSKEMYICVGTEDCKYTQLISVPPAKDCYDYTGWGNNAEKIYESMSVGEHSNMIFFSVHCWADCYNLQYCRWNITGKNNFGCVNLKRKSYCILNKQYSKEEYEKLKTQIIIDMDKNPYIDKNGRVYKYGEFFPIEFSNLFYNKSCAMKFLPKNKEEALAEGYNWSVKRDVFYESTLLASSLPERIIDTKDSILKEIIKCENCQRGYKITQGELSLLRKMNLPIPHKCPKCREAKRFGKMTKPIFYNRTCAKCNKNIYTPFSPSSPEIVYCVSCYQQEFS